MVLESLDRVLHSTSFALQSTSQQYYFVLQSLHKKNTSLYYFVLQSLHKVLPSTTFYRKVAHFHVLLCTTKLAPLHFPVALHPVLLCTTKLARSTVPSTTLYYKACTKSLPSTTLYYKACTKRTSQYYFVLQSSCTKHFPVLLCTKLAKWITTVLESLHKSRPGTTLYYKACTKYFTVPLCTTKLAPVLLCTTGFTKHFPVLLYYKACTQYFPVLLCTVQSLHKALLRSALCKLCSTK